GVRGEVISVRGSGMRATFTVRKVSEGVGVERTFPLHAPTIAEIKVVKHAKVRRAKLFYLRGRQGKAARLTESRGRGEAGEQGGSPTGAGSRGPRPVWQGRPLRWRGWTR